MNRDVASLRRRDLRFRAGDAEDLIHFVDKEIEFGIGEVAVGIELFEFDGGGFCGGVIVLAENERFAADAGNRV